MQCVQLFEFLEGKNVVLVGGAPTYKKESLTDYDVVVWLNNHWDEESPVDAVYACGIDPPLKPYTRLQYVVCQIDSNAFAEWMALGLAFEALLTPIDCTRYLAMHRYGYSHQWINVLHNRMETKPLSGVIATEHLLLHPINSLHLTGFTFYEKDGRVPWKVHAHLMQPQLDYFADRLKNDHRIKMDEEMLRIVRENAVAEEPKRVYQVTEMEGDIIWTVDAV